LRNSPGGYYARLKRPHSARARADAALHARIVGGAMATHLRTELVLEALNFALWQRRLLAVIHHSDQGSQYTSLAFGKRCKAAGVRPSMGSVSDGFDNPMCESFCATLECELLDRCRFKTPGRSTHGGL
jgi:putative transposase